MGTDESVKNISLRELSSRGGKRNKHLILSIEDMVFGIPLSQVKEIIGMITITQMPDTPSYFRGIINLRGMIISILDLKSKLSIAKKGLESKRPCIVICEFGNIVLGSIVDDVLEVYGFEENDIERNVDVENEMHKQYVTGVAKSSTKGLVLLLDIGKVLHVDELAKIHQNPNQQQVA